MNKKFTLKQQLFIQEYLVDMNATQAAIRAGYSKHTAQKIGSENLSKPVIFDAITEAMEARANRTEITQDMVIRELARIAFFDIRETYDENGVPIPLHNLSADAAAAVGAKISDKKAALELLGKHLKMFTDKIDMQHSGGITLKAILAKNDQGGLPAPPVDQQAV